MITGNSDGRTVVEVEVVRPEGGLDTASSDQLAAKQVIFVTDANYCVEN